jgi:general secretion pathway protein G
MKSPTFAPRRRDSFRPLVAPRIRGRKASRGFTLLEIVIVIALIGLILGLVANKIMGSQKRAEYRIAEASLTTLAGKIDQYESDVGELPDSLDALVTAPTGADGWLGPYAKKAELTDPWHQRIEYRKPGDNDAPYQLVSLGADKKAGGDGVDKDIVKP